MTVQYDSPAYIHSTFYIISLDHSFLKMVLGKKVILIIIFLLIKGKLWWPEHFLISTFCQLPEVTN